MIPDLAERADKLLVLFEGQMTCDGVIHYGAWQRAPVSSILDVSLKLTLDSGADGGLRVWLQGSPDDGVNAFDLYAHQQGTQTATTPEVAANVNNRLIVNGATGASSMTAIYKHLATDRVRPVWHSTTGAAPRVFTARLLAAGRQI